MRAFVTRAEGDRPGLRFEPETLEERIFLEMLARRNSISDPEKAQVHEQATSALSAEQRQSLVQFQEACFMIGAHDGCADWAVLGCAIETELAALSLGSARASRDAASRALHRAELEKYLARNDACGCAKAEGAIRALLVAGAEAAGSRSSDQTKQEEAWIADDEGACDPEQCPCRGRRLVSPSDRPVTWHVTRSSAVQVDGASAAASPGMILALCGKVIPCYRILQTSRIAPLSCGSCRDCDRRRRRDPARID